MFYYELFEGVCDLTMNLYREELANISFIVRDISQTLPPLG